MTGGKRHIRATLYARDILSLALVLGICLISGCSDSPPESASRVVYIQRELSSGDFWPYAINDRKAIDRLRVAILDDMNAPKPPRHMRPKSSVNHVVLFCKPDDTTVFKCLLQGNSYLLVGEERYYCRATIDCLRDLMKSEFKAAPMKTVEGLKDVRDIVGGNIGKTRDSHLLSARVVCK